jgi:hypothetical protein
VHELAKKYDLEWNDVTHFDDDEIKDFQLCIGIFVQSPPTAWGERPGIPSKVANLAKYSNASRIKKKNWILL